MHSSPLAVAVAATIAWAILLVATRVVLIRFEINAWGFTLVQLLTGGLAMMAFGRRATIAWASLLSPSIWAYGALRVVSAGSASAALLYVTVMQDTLLAAMNVPLAALVLVVVTRQRLPGGQLLAHAIMIAGIAIMAFSLPGGLLNPAVMLEVIAECAVVASTLLIERHPENRRDDIQARCLFTGTVLMVTAAMFILAWAISGALGVSIGSNALAFGDFGQLFAPTDLLIACAGRPCTWRCWRCGWPGHRPIWRHWRCCPSPAWCSRPLAHWPAGCHGRRWDRRKSPPACWSCAARCCWCGCVRASVQLSILPGGAGRRPL